MKKIGFSSKKLLIVTTALSVACISLALQQVQAADSSVTIDWGVLYGQSAAVQPSAAFENADHVPAPQESTGALVKTSPVPAPVSTPAPVVASPPVVKAVQPPSLPVAPQPPTTSVAVVPIVPPVRIAPAPTVAAAPTPTAPISAKAEIAHATPQPLVTEVKVAAALQLPAEPTNDAGNQMADAEGLAPENTPLEDAASKNTGAVHSPPMAPMPPAEEILVNAVPVEKTEIAPHQAAVPPQPVSVTPPHLPQPEKQPEKIPEKKLPPANIGGAKTKAVVVVKNENAPVATQNSNTSSVPASAAKPVSAPVTPMVHSAPTSVASSSVATSSIANNSQGLLLYRGRATALLPAHKAQLQPLAAAMKNDASLMLRLESFSALAMDTQQEVNPAFQRLVYIQDYLASEGIGFNRLNISLKRAQDGRELVRVSLPSGKK
ncbi:MAG: hypothetical protein ACOYK8_08595 [Alphaproteobacteria bacterium]